MGTQAWRIALTSGVNRLSNLLGRFIFSLAGHQIPALENRLSSLPNPKLVPRRVPEPELTPTGSHFWWIAIPSFLAVALAVLAAVLLVRTEDMKKAIAETEHQSARQVTDLANAQKILETMGAPDSVRMTLSTPVGHQPTAQAVYQASRGRLAFVASNLPPLKFGQIYQLWVVTKASTILPAGTFAPDERGHASHFMAMPPNLQARNFEVTTEPAGGTLKPTTKPILSGTIE